LYMKKKAPIQTYWLSSTVRPRYGIGIERGLERREGPDSKVQEGKVRNFFSRSKRIKITEKLRGL